VADGCAAGYRERLGGNVCEPRLGNTATLVRPSMRLVERSGQVNEYAADNILVNTICLGRLKSAQWTRRWHAHFSHMTLDAFYAKQGESMPLKRLGEAEDVADLVCFLASERARYITGTAINIDGGISGAV
jgi:NAD(P)-dependent dehydrogenase (short-subunit alcohol dehydrogenase family)